MFKNVLVGADDSSTALRAVAAAVDLARTLGAKLHVVTAYRPELVLGPHVIVSVGYIPIFAALDDGPVVSADEAANALLARLGSLAAAAGVDAAFHAVNGEPAEAIVNMANEVGADLIVVGNKGMRGAKRVLGSVPNSIAHRAQCAVLIVDTTTPDR
jgi:nucleotide-binding universal stress UspA family protein